MANIADTIRSWLIYVPRITIANIIEIAIIAYIVYGVLLWIQNTKAWALLKGIGIILGFTVVAVIFRFDAILWILSNVATIAFTAIVIIFQPEIRNALEQLGRKDIFKYFFLQGKSKFEFTQEIISEIVKASEELSKNKTGALMVIEGTQSLKNIEDTGIVIDGKLSNQLLINIFEHNTPLHDGAVVIQADIIKAATCYLPLSSNMRISKALGTRHRAALGISEVTDALTIVVSEETGGISIAKLGELKKVKDGKELGEMLAELNTTTVSTQSLSFLRGSKPNERNDN